MPPADPLVPRLRGDDPDARRALFEREGPRLWSLVYRLCGDYDVAQDVTQETFLAAFRKIGRFGESGSLRGWLGRIAVNLLRDQRRTQRRRDETLLRFPVPGAAEAPSGEPFVRRRVHAAVDALGEKLRTVLLMHDLEEYTHEEIAQALGIAPGSSRARLSRARALLREALADLAPEDAR
ncbi:MAG TPA: RNA polymerase sigma factor [Longimicrobium sp.]|nr:RNA polymerase sigma factor [Longimicrobium sp.]